MRADRTNKEKLRNVFPKVVWAIEAFDYLAERGLYAIKAFDHLAERGLYK